MKTLRVSDELSLPLEAVTQKLGWLGVTGSGKTYGASKLAELMVQAGAQIVVLDPVGVWYGLRLKEDGKTPSDIKIPIFGGLHADVPLEYTAGALVANLVVDKGISVIIDVSQFESDTQKSRFAQEFADRFFFRKKAEPSAVHLFIEECQEFVPQNPQREETRMLHAFTRMQKLGRNFGIGSSYISQRPQEVNKKALNMAQTLFVFRTTGSQERAAIEKWIGDKGLDQDIAGDLPKIVTGHCHVWSPEFLKISNMVRIDRKETFNASATPEVGRIAKARHLAPVDLENIKSSIAASIEKAKAEDPKELKKKISDLEKQMRGMAKGPIVLAKHPGNASRSATHKPTTATITLAKSDGEATLKAGAKRMLAALVTWAPNGITEGQMRAQAGMKDSGSYASYKSSLRTQGLAEQRDGLWYATQTGIDFLGESIPSPRTTEEVLAIWNPKLKAGARRMLEVLINWGTFIDDETLRNESGMSDSGSYASYKSSLRTAQLAVVKDGQIAANKETLFL